jgi:hypothetical protein
MDQLERLQRQRRPRYQSALKRDLYRAIETLRKIQAVRREGEK